MKILAPRGTLRRTVWLCQIALMAAALGALGYSAFVVTDTWNFQSKASRAFEQARLQPALARVPGGVAVDGLMGRLEISRLGLSVIVSEGTNETTLRRTAGHIAGTGLPGRPGNVGIAAHRDSLFRPLRNIRPDDLITLSTLQGEYRYRVVSTKIVDPSDVTVLDPGEDEALTLVTCYPFYFVGPAPKRFIVRAEKAAGQLAPGSDLTQRPHMSRHHGA